MSSMISPLEPLRLLQKNRTSSTSLELICIPHGHLEGKDVADMPYGDETWTTHSVAMEREGGREGECVEGVGAYRYLRWDVNAIKRVCHTFASDSMTTSLLESVSSPHPILPIVRLPLLVIQVDVILQIPTSPIPTFSWLRSCADPTLFISYSDSIPCLQFVTLPPTPSTSNDELRFLLRGSIPAKQLSNRPPLPSTMVFHQRLHSTRANALFPLPSCNDHEFNARALPAIWRFILRNWRRGGRIWLRMVH